MLSMIADLYYKRLNDPSCMEIDVPLPETQQSYIKDKMGF